MGTLNVFNTFSTPEGKPAFHHVFAWSELAAVTSRRNNNRKAGTTNTACQRRKVMRAAILLVKVLKTMLLFTESRRWAGLPGLRGDTDTYRKKATHWHCPNLSLLQECITNKFWMNRLCHSWNLLTHYFWEIRCARKCLDIDNSHMQRTLKQQEYKHSQRCHKMLQNVRVKVADIAQYDPFILMVPLSRV